MIRIDAKTALIIWLAGSMPAPFAMAAEEPSATPYRPTVSNPAALPVPGYLELELGVTSAQGGAEARRRNSLPVVAKYAFSENLGVLVGSELAAKQTGHDGEKVSGVGDTTLQLKLKRDLTQDSALGLEAGVKLATAKTGLGSDKRDYLVNGIYSSEVGECALDVNVGYTHFGVTGDESRHGMSWAAAIGRELGEKWGIAIELSGTARQRERPTNQFMVALSYNVSKQVVLDAAVALGLSRSTPDRTLLTGMTILLR